MRTTGLFAVVLMAGCGGTQAALPIVSSTSIPGTQIEVVLIGPNSGGQFAYVIQMPDRGMTRALGRLSSRQQSPANLEVIGDGVCRIQWGDGPHAPYAVIDVGNLVIVEDSNPANPKNVRFPKSR